MRKKEAGIPPVEHAFFRDFYARHKKLIYFFAKQYVSDRSDLEDLVQDVILRLMHYIPALMEIRDSSAQTAAYLSLTVRSVYIDRLRSNRVKQISVIPVEILELIYDESADRSELLEHTAALLDAQMLKKHLPERDWELLSGKYILGYSDAELARQQGCAPDSVRMAISRAKKHARVLLEKSRGDANES